METIKTVDYNGLKFYFYKTPALDDLVAEIFSDNYNVIRSGLEFDRGDVILDIGANEGVFSILMAKLFPLADITAFEPVQSTFYQMVRNVGLNMVSNITEVNKGVGAQNGDRIITVSNSRYSGGSTLFMTPTADTHDEEISVTTLDSILARFNQSGDKVKLLKMDIEGGEYEAIYNSKLFGSTVVNMVAEFHINQRLRAMGYDIDGLARYIRSKGVNLIYYESCNMSE